MSERLPQPPAPIPPPDRTQIERLNTLYDLSAPDPAPGWRAATVDRLRSLLARILFRQQEFNAAVVDHLNRNAIIGIEAHHASVRASEWVTQTLQSTLDDLRRHQQALAAWERRSAAAVESVAASHEELRTSLTVLQQAAQTLKREVSKIATGDGTPAASARTATPAHQGETGSRTDALDSHKYVGFEDLFRGSPEDIRQRVSEYLPLFADTNDVLDIGCGRGEFLTLLRENGVTGRGIDLNAAMVEVCRGHGLDVTEADALAYLRAQPDGSLGGIFAAQVIEHLEPRDLIALLDAAFDKLRPGAPIVLETINPACWFAFFESYIRDITHVRPIHPETLKYLLIASGFQHVDVRYRAPYPEHEKLQPVPPNAALGEQVNVLNANVERLNRLLFTWMDYAAVGKRA